MTLDARRARLKAFRLTVQSKLGQQVLKDYQELLDDKVHVVGRPPEESATLQELQEDLRRAHTKASRMAERISELENTTQCLRAALMTEDLGANSAILESRRIAARLGLPEAPHQPNSRSAAIHKARDVIREELHAKGFSWDDIGEALGIGGRSAQTMSLRKKHDAL